MSRDSTGGAEGVFPEGFVFRETAQSHEELREIAAFWSLETIQLQSGRYRGCVSAVHTARTQLAIANHECGTWMGGTVPKETFVMGFGLREDTELRFRGTALGQTAVCLHDSRNGLDFSFHTPADVVCLAMDRRDIERRVNALWQNQPAWLSSGVLELHDQAAMASIQRLAMECFQEAVQAPAALLTGRAGKQFENRLIEGILSAVRGPSRLENGFARRWIARRAADFLHAHFREDVGISDLCAAVGATRRTLHMGFLEVYGMPPMRYLTVLRLNAARCEMLARRTREASVTRIAADCGFTHMGRFSAAYREFFGLMPSREGRVGT